MLHARILYTTTSHTLYYKIYDFVSRRRIYPGNSTKALFTMPQYNESLRRRRRRRRRGCLDPEATVKVQEQNEIENKKYTYKKNDEN